MFPNCLECEKGICPKAQRYVACTAPLPVEDEITPVKVAFLLSLLGMVIFAWVGTYTSTTSTTKSSYEEYLEKVHEPRQRFCETLAEPNRTACLAELNQ